MFKEFFIKHGRKCLATSLLVCSGLLIAHFVTQYYYKQSLIDTIFKPPALIVNPSTAPKSTSPKILGGGAAPSVTSQPKAGGGTSAAPAPAKTPTPSPNDDVKVEIFGLIKFEMSESNSWQTIAKIMTVILGTFLGMRAINAVFSRLEKQDPDPTNN